MKTKMHPDDYRKPKGVYTSYTTRTCEICGHDIISPEGLPWACAWCEQHPAEKPLTVGEFDLDKIVSKDIATSFKNFMGPLDPPDDYRIYNRKQADGTYPPLSKFFDGATEQPINFAEPARPEAEAQEAQQIDAWLQGGAVYMQGEVPKSVLQKFAEKRDEQFNRHYYNNPDGKPEFIYRSVKS